MKVFYKQVQLNPTAETDYTDLVNKPSLNGVELEGDLSTEQIKITWYGTQEEFDALPSHDPYTIYIIDDGTPVGTQDSYLDLADKPSINGQILTGNKLPSDLDMYSRPDVDNLLASMRSIKVVATKPAAPAANTMYYVGPDSESNYHVYLYDALLNEIDLGMAMNQLYREGTAIDIDSANTINVKIDDETIKTNASNEVYVNYDNVSIKKDATNGKLYVPTTKSGDRYDVYPYTDGSGITFVGRSVRFVSSDTDTGVVSNIDTHTSGTPAANTGNFWVNNGVDSTKSGIMLTTGLVDNKTIKYDGTNSNIYVNNSDTIVGTTDADKIALTKRAIQKYTYSLAASTSVSISIPRNSDLNTAEFTAIGNYVCDPDYDVRTLTNCPTDEAFRMTVESQIRDTTDPINAVWQFRLRTIKDVNGNIFVQNISTDNTTTITYSPWEQIMTSGSVRTLNSNSSNAISIPANANLNSGTYLQPRNYYCDTNTTAATLTNCPVTVGFKMFVELPINDKYNGSGSWEYVVRHLVDIRGNEFTQYISISPDGTASYEDWKQIVKVSTTTPIIAFDSLSYGVTLYDSHVYELRPNLYYISIGLNCTSITQTFNADTEYNIGHNLKINGNNLAVFSGIGVIQANERMVPCYYNGGYFYIRPVNNLAAGANQVIRLCTIVSR